MFVQTLIIHAGAKKSRIGKRYFLPLGFANPGILGEEVFGQRIMWMDFVIKSTLWLVQSLTMELTFRCKKTRQMILHTI